MRYYWSALSMDLYVLCVFLFLNLVEKSSQNYRHHHDRWEHISVRYGIWYNLPPYQSKAFEEGYRRLNDVCKTDLYHGFLFAKRDNMKAMPIYDLNGNLAGIQSAIPGKMRGYNSMNQSIDLPPVEIMPPVLKGLQDANNNEYYTVTAYFKHPKLICSPIAPDGVSPSRGLYIQMGFNPQNDFLYIPKESKHLSPLWNKGNCVPMMGTHYFMNLSHELPCEKLYPLFLMYDMEGHLGAFGWVFQGRPNNFYSEDGQGWFHLTPITYPFLYNTKMLPPCMFYKKFQVFGIHIYLQPRKNLICKRVNPSLHLTTTQNPRTLSRASPQPQPNVRTDLHNDQPKYTNSENYAIEAYDSHVNSGASRIFTKSFIVPVTVLMVVFSMIPSSVNLLLHQKLNPR